MSRLVAGRRPRFLQIRSPDFRLLRGNQKSVAAMPLIVTLFEKEGSACIA